MHKKLSSDPTTFLSQQSPTEREMIPSPFPLIFFFLLISLSSAEPFIPEERFLIDCGAANPTTSQGRTFLSDSQSATYLSSSSPQSISLSSADLPSPNYLSSALVFPSESTYTFKLTRPNIFFVRLHFLPLNHSEFDLSSAVFSVSINSFVALHSFSCNDLTTPISKEYVINTTYPILYITFSPQRNSLAFINAIEAFSIPFSLLPSSLPLLFPIGASLQLDSAAFQTVYRVNVGGPLITPTNDTLSRTWQPDEKFLQSKSTAEKVNVPPSTVVYPEGGTTDLIAPNWVYSTGVKMADARVGRRNFNVSWQFDVDPSYAYLVRLHFCDVISKSLNDLYFNVYINERMGVSGLDLSTLTGQLAAAYYRDFLLNASIAGDRITVKVGPMADDNGQIDAILNGIEVFKMSNSVGSLDGEFGVHGFTADSDSSSGGRTAVAAVGFTLMFGAFAGLGAMVMKWYKRPQDWEKRNSFSSWLLPLHSGHSSSFMTSSKGYGLSFSSSLGLGRYFSFNELQEATKGFSKEEVIGVGGFGEVFFGLLDDGTKVAVKRGNSQSEQGINEFQTEIQILSKLRHRHLVSLIGYCDENSEMILVYEYMANGVLRDHLYGKNLPPLTWKQRLEICIGAARGLHYLHTGAAQGIIHRDVKTTNILLDEGFVAKVSDFGLSKDAPTTGGAVSTAVKGSFGYLDPEYFRRQQLTEKSDVYSFGVVLLETLCARPALNPALPREKVNLAEWGMQMKKKGELEKIVDPVLVGTMNVDSMNKFVEAAEKCLAEFGVDRPSMGDVLWNLEHALQIQERAPPGLVRKNGQGEGED